MYSAVGLLSLLLLIGAGTSKGAFDFKSKLAEILLGRIDAVIEQNLAASIEYLDEEGMTLGGLVHNVQEIFSQGIKAGTSETEVINSSGEWIGRIIGRGTVFSTSTGAVATTTAANVCDSSIWQITPGGGNAPTQSVTLYFPATTTLYADCLTMNGQSVEFTVYNATTTGTGTVTLTKGWVLGTDLRGSTSTDNTVLVPDEWARIVMERTSLTTTTVFINPYTLGD